MSYFHNDNINTKCIKHNIERCQFCSHAQHIEQQIKSLKIALPYADGQAYYNDKRKIEEMQKELRNHLRG